MRPGRLHFTCLVAPDTVNERLALVLKRQLEAVGVDMSVGRSADGSHRRRGEEPHDSRRR